MDKKLRMCDDCDEEVDDLWEFPVGSGIDLCEDCYRAASDEEPPR